MVLPREALRSLAEQGGATIVGCSPGRAVAHLPVSQQLLFRWWYEWIYDEGSLESVVMWHKVDNMKPEVVPYVFSVRHAEIVPASGRLQNLSCAIGRPSFEMSRSFRYQSPPTELLFPAINVNVYGIASTRRHQAQHTSMFAHWDVDKGCASVVLALRVSRATLFNQSRSR